MTDENSNHSPFDLAVNATLNELTTRFQTFADEAMSDATQHAIVSLITWGFAKSRIAFKIHHPPSGEWILVRYVVSGNFADRLRIVMFAECPAEWVEPGKPLPRIVREPNAWDLKISDVGLRSRNALCGKKLIASQVARDADFTPSIQPDWKEFGRDVLTLTQIVEDDKFSAWATRQKWWSEFGYAGRGKAQWCKDRVPEWIRDGNMQVDPRAPKNGQVRFLRAFLQTMAVKEPVS